jgi:hypothetical protein
MQPQQNFNASGPTDRICAQCGAPMPKEMRFCRSCGNRLGEGPAEYTETVRLPGATASRAPGTTPFYPSVNAPLIQQSGGSFRRRRRLGFTGMTWMWIALGLFFAGGGLMSAFVKNVGRIPRAAAPAFNRSFFGVDGFKTGNGGATFDVVEPPEGPADKAGLVGGDTITSFDGRQIRTESDIMDALRQTPIGKRVEVIYFRDGNFHNTQLITMSSSDSDQLSRAYDRRPEGKGHLGFDDGDARRVPIAGTNIFGVQLNDVSQNGPLDLAGVKEGDVVIEFDGVPIRTVDELTSRDHRAIPYSTIKMVVMRGAEKIEIPVKVGKE